MLLGALLDLRAGSGDERMVDVAVLKTVVEALGLPDDLVEVSEAVLKGISCTRVTVRAEQSPPLRRLKNMEQLISSAGLSSWVVEHSLSAVRRLAEVEAHIHGCGVEDVHFHEVGAADTLVDVVGTFALVDALMVDRVLCGPVQLGGGTVEIDHGRMSVPAPATATLLVGLSVLGGPEMQELTTPTGALLLSELGAKSGPLPHMIVEAIGYGGGQRKLEGGPNVLRVLVGDAVADLSTVVSVPTRDDVVELQTNLDDVSSEVVGHAVARLRRAGALDVWTSPAQGKKDRPVTVLHVLTATEGEEELADILFRETGTLGIRRLYMTRMVAERGYMVVEVLGLPVTVKWGWWEGRLISLAPEYEQAAEVATETGLPLMQVMSMARAAARESFERDLAGNGGQLR